MPHQAMLDRSAPSRPAEPAELIEPADVIEVVGEPPATLVPVLRGGRRPRVRGAFVLTPGDVRYLPAPDVELLAGIAAAVLIAVAGSAAAAARHRSPAIGTVRMGPGGWVSLKRTTAPALRSDRTPRPRTPRPWWARALRAHRLVVQP